MSVNLSGRKVARAHYYKPNSTEPLCNSGNFGYEPRPAKKGEPLCQHCLRLLKKSESA